MPHSLSSMLGVGATLVLLAACDGPSDMIDQPGTKAPSVVSESEGIRLTLQTDKSEYDPGEPVLLTFEVKNTTNVRQSFSFSEACQNDFRIREGDVLVWNFNHDQMCAQVVTSLELEPGETWTRSEVWDQRTNKGEPAGSGAYDAKATLTQTGKPLDSEPLRIVIR
jgi:hypothetical protein